MTSKASEKNIDLQVLRGVAIASVLLVHLSVSASLLGLLPIQIVNPLYAGVELFFVLSGFVVTQAARRGEYEVGRFLIRRCFRLYPSMLVFVIVSLGVNYFYRDVQANEWARGFFSIPYRAFLHDALAILGGYKLNVVTSESYNNAAMWSLSVEFQFYAATAILLAAKRLFHMRVETVTRLLFWIAIGVLALCVYLRICALIGISLRLQYLTTWKFDFLAGGVLLALVDADKIRHWCARSLSIAPIIAFATPLVALAMVRSPLILPKRGEADFLEGIAMPIALLCFGALVALGSIGNKFSVLGVWTRAVLAWVGDRSYTIYLLQFPILALAWSIIGAFRQEILTSERLYGPTQLLVTLVLLVPLAELVYRFIELPAIDAGARLLRRRGAVARKAQPAPSSVAP